MFDNICKFIAETFSTDFAAWLLGEPITFTELSPKELSLEPIRADALILLQSDEVVLHLEFQTQPDANIPFRMADYRLRVYRRFPQKRMRQVVIYLTETTSELVYQTSFRLENLRHDFTVIRLWEEPTEIFLRTPGLLPFAVLSDTDNKTGTLQEVAAQIDKIADRRMQNNLTASTAILAGLVLEERAIQRLLRREMMRESVIYQSIINEALEEGRVEGRAEGREEGIQEKAQQIAINLLAEGMSPEVVAKVTGLTLEQVEKLQLTEGDRQN
ncbi:Rpn family recombination-promoting nuclease/putative transposase [Nostoc sp. 106C]|uniref:Rpn family recombination-promoting nuclease/putative transposase n=1 Tax=Nostoc sp. 106C TaxID=1932667 RepID=UPI000A3CB452|nr:Rpn family recombination-promoting nuclease/putative transposase [Nostoc sp. 106C]OUL21354.1 flagellar assembly protein H [Nostoc sp. 106C]